MTRAWLVLMLWAMSAVAAPPARPVPRLGEPVPPPDPSAAVGVNVLAWSPDGQTLAAGTLAGHIQLWDVASRKPRLAPMTHRAGIAALTFSPDGLLLASGSRDRTAAIWDTKKGTRLHSFAKFEGWVGGVVFSPDGSSLATGSDARTDTLRIWKVDTGEQIRLIPRAWGAIRFLRYATDPRHLLVLRDEGTFHIHDIEKGTLHVTFDNANRIGSSIVCSADRRTVVTASHLDRNAIVWETATGQVRARMQLDAATQEAALSPDGRLLAVASIDDLTVWDLATGKPVLRYGALPADVFSLAFSPDGKTLASGHRDMTVRLWDTSTACAPVPARSLKEAELESLWESLAGTDPRSANEAMWRVVADRESVPMLLKRLQQMTTPHDRFLRQRIRDLDSDQIKVRRRAEEQLLRWGLDAIEPMRDVLDNEPSLEVRRRIEKMLPRMLAGGVTQEKAVISRGIETLERIGTEEARKALAELAKGPEDVVVTCEAQSALARWRGR
jgi:hypothetical protein